MVEIKLVKRINELGPDISAVVNCPEYVLPSRGYIFKEDIEEVYGNLENAINYFTDRAFKISKRDNLYLIGFVFGKIQDNNKKERDIFVFPFSESSGGRLTRAEPHIIKDNVQLCWTPRFKEDFGILLSDEAIHRRTHSFEDYIHTFPKLRFHEYLS